MIRLLTRSIRNKLLAITGLGTALVVAASLFGLLQAWQGLQGFERLMGEEIALSHDIERLRLDFARQDAEWKRVLIRGDDHIAREQHLEAFYALREQVAKDAKALLAAVDLPEARSALETFLKRHGETETTYREALDTYKLLGYNARMADDQAGGIAGELGALLDRAGALLAEEAQQKTRYNVGAASSIMINSLLVMALAIGVAFVVFLLLVNRSIIKPTRTLVEDLGRFADGDFSHSIDLSTQDELGQVAQSAQQLQARLGRTLGQIADAVAQVASSAEEMAVISEQTTQGVSQQRSETSQAAAAMNQMSATVQEVARHAAQAAESAQRADQKAGQGRQVVERTKDAISALADDVEQAVAAIERLDEDSAAIGTVLDVIRGIAEQTNLLALNAAIEAARAGEQGRGFAVVADEVRTLALRTQKSTQEIQDMIERVQAGSSGAVKVMDTSRDKAKQAVEAADAAGASLKAITDAVGTIKDMNNQIASAAEEQSATAEEMNRNITTISQISEQNADGAAQTTTASEELAKLATNLQNLVGQFKLREGRVAK